MTLRENLAARASPRSVIPWGAHGPTPGPGHISRHRPSEHSFLQHAPFLRATCAHLASPLMSAPLGPMGISRSTSSCALSRQYLDDTRRYLPRRPHGALMVSRWYLDGISIGISMVSRRPHGALTMDSASSAACSCSRRNGTINGHAPGFFHSRGWRHSRVHPELHSSLAALPPPVSQAHLPVPPTLPHSRCQSPQPVPVPTASDLTHTQAAILRILRQRSYAWAPA